MSKECKLLIVV